MRSKTAMFADGRDSSGGKDQERFVAAPGSVLCERFVVAEELDYGRLGIVYKARDHLRPPGRDQHVALLLVPPKLTRSAHLLEVFKGNVAQLQRVTHPNIAKVFDINCHENRWLLTMELADGASVRRLLDCFRPRLINEREALEIVDEIGAALVHAHKLGFVHGDVRPDNVLVTMAHQVKVLFVSTRGRKSALPADPRDDVYGLAYIAYELLAGERPFGGELGSRAGEWGARLKRSRHLSRSQWQALRAALASREQRTASVSQFLAELHAGSAATGRLQAYFASPELRWSALAAGLLVTVAAGYALRGGEVVEPAPPADAAPAFAAVVTQSGEAARGQVGGLSSPAPGNLDGRVSSSEPASIEPRATAPGREPASSVNAVTPMPSTVGFATRGVSISESTGAVAVEIRRTGGTDPVSIVWWTTAGTARADEDFTDFPAVVERLESDEVSRTIVIPIVADATLEGRESFRVHLHEGSGKGVRVGGISQTAITILDDDSELRTVR